MVDLSFSHHGKINIPSHLKTHLSLMVHTILKVLVERIVYGCFKMVKDLLLSIWNSMSTYIVEEASSSFASNFVSQDCMF
jgi:hypothetical protein